jgi:hypothetical protein
MKPEKPEKKAGKRSDPNYRQVSAWVRRDTYDRVTIRLIKEDRKEFSELVQELMEQWLRTR